MVDSIFVAFCNPADEGETRPAAIPRGSGSAIRVGSRSPSPQGPEIPPASGSMRARLASTTDLDATGHADARALARRPGLMSVEAEELARVPAVGEKVPIKFRPALGEHGSPHPMRPRRSKIDFHDRDAVAEHLHPEMTQLGPKNCTVPQPQRIFCNRIAGM